MSQKPDPVAVEVTRDVVTSALPKWYDVPLAVVKRVRNHLRRRGIRNIGYTSDPDGGYWFRRYDNKEKK